MKKIIAKTLNHPESSVCDCLAIFIPHSADVPSRLKTINKQLNNSISLAIKSQEFSQELGNSLLLNTPTQNYKHLLLISLGKHTTLHQSQWLQTLDKLNLSLKNLAFKKSSLICNSCASLIKQ